jgi:hypothetical protein
MFNQYKTCKCCTIHIHRSLHIKYSIAAVSSITAVSKLHLKFGSLKLSHSSLPCKKYNSIMHVFEHAGDVNTVEVVGPVDGLKVKIKVGSIAILILVHCLL